MAVRASKKLKNDELLLGKLGSTILRKHLDEIPLWRGDHVMVRTLVEDFARYLYLPRLARPEVLVQALREGVALLTWQAETFAYAEGYQEADGRYRGLRAGQLVAPSAEDSGLIVKPKAARQQLGLEATHEPPGSGYIPSGAPSAGKEADPPRRPRRFHGSVLLDPTRVGRDASRVADEVIAHLSGQPGAKVVVTLEIQVHLPGGANEQTVRTVTENCRALKFSSFGFETE